MRWRAPGTDGEGIQRGIDSSHSYHLSRVIDGQSSTVESRTKCAEIDDFNAFPQNRMLLWVPSLRVDFRSARASCCPATRIDRGRVAKVHARERTQISKDSVLPAECMGKEAVCVAAVWRVRIVYRTIRPAYNYSRIINKLSTFRAIDIPVSGRTT